eukprot:GHVO01014026.1.p1 GENE.GHVO01014026.1~~GHVO01014026.1.p1  ORF type:complete len:264 (-),score=30.04 GHVO01014026.1:148-837(-)
MGPFLDMSHEIIQRGGTVQRSFSSPHSSPVSYDSIYRHMWNRVGQLRKTKVVIVPHPDDVLHPPSLPQPPFNNKIFCDGNPPPNIDFVSNPCLMSVNGVAMSVTSCDVLMSICGASISRGIQSNKFDDAVDEILRQRTFFPVHPPRYPIEPSCASNLRFKENDVPSILISRAGRRQTTCTVTSGYVYLDVAPSTSPSKTLSYCQLYIQPPTENAVDVKDRCRVDVHSVK